MPSSPRIFRTVPQGPITRPDTAIPVVATMRWATGEVLAVAAEAVAWTRSAVQVTWTPPGGPTRTDWIAATDVRRSGGPPESDRIAAADVRHDPPEPHRTPPRSATRRRPRW